ncbi:Hypothetical protein CINCED_3A018233 [Cinara cedri]|uniref:Endonuclease/exonuclease/phosphatase n=1 Tax=Cinara cedri TaxID=506608 RepID=A0A5E4N9P7_9HEMI|nr:Hypothetical protein CINCED_3A018233 [Cinara cedri]
MFFSTQNILTGAAVPVTLVATLFYKSSPTNNTKFTFPDPTYWPTSPSKRPDILDIFISNVPNGLYQHTENFNFLLSDHSAVLTINASLPFQSLKPSLTNKNTDWNSFWSQLSNDSNLNIKLKSPEDIEDAITKLNQLIQRAAWNSSPISQPSPPSFINIPTHICHVISEKRHARTQ